MRKIVNLKQTLTGWNLLLLSLLSWLASAAEIETQLLVFRVTEPGAEPYISRVLVTPDHLRMDQGQDALGFILLDREAKAIYNVNPDDQSILLIEPKERDRTIPASVELSARQKEEPGMPEVAGKRPQYWQFFVNGQLCRSAVVAPSLFPRAAAAYAEYLDLLADQQQSTQVAMPLELHDPCELAIHIYAPGAVLEKGLPLREWNEQGRRQELIDFKDTFAISADSFQLPDDYRRLLLNQM